MGGAESLSDLEVLVLDCQTTGATPSRGALLEIGWARSRAAVQLEPTSVTSRLVEQPAGAELPPRIARLTGITATALEAARSPGEAWAELLDARPGPTAAPTPTVIHFARFETPFLLDLKRRCQPEGDFPFDIVCSHEIARRLLPGLPRKGLRAVAGYLGLSVPELRRSAEHVVATAFVWRRLVELLDAHYRISTRAGLADWLARSTPPPRPRKSYPMPRSLRLALPDRPGVYRMLRKNGDLLYVGKATSLRRRVNSYFTKQSRIADRTLEMLAQARDLEVTVTESALEAALLESDEIKRHGPPYNVALRDDARELLRFSPRTLAASPERGRWGPLPAPIARATATLCALLEAPSPATVPDPVPWSEMGVHLAAGLERFRERHRAQLDAAAVAHALRAIGTESWRARLDQDRDQDQDQDQGQDQGQDQDRRGARDGERWDGERVADFLDGVALRFAHDLRRTRWFGLLGDSSLAWGDPARGPLRMLTIARGQISNRDRIAAADRLGPPPGRGEPIDYLDPATWDRLRVLTTELRRLLRCHPAVAVRLASGRLLDRAALTRILPWI